MASSSACSLAGCLSTQSSNHPFTGKCTHIDRSRSMHTSINTHTSMHLAEQSELLIVEAIKAVQRDDSCFFYILLYFVSSGHIIYLIQSACSSLLLHLTVFILYSLQYSPLMYFDIADSERSGLIESSSKCAILVYIW